LEVRISADVCCYKIIDVNSQAFGNPCWKTGKQKEKGITKETNKQRERKKQTNEERNKHRNKRRKKQTKQQRNKRRINERKKD
jgi:C1A family cysteine protease